MSRRYLLFANQLYAYSILRPLQAAIRRRGDQVAWFVHGTDAGYLQADEQRLDSVAAVRRFRPDAVLTAANWVPDFFPGLKVEVFHGFNALKREADVGHFRIRGLFDLYCTQGPSTTGPFRELARQHGYFAVVETGWPKVDPLFDPQAPDWRRGRRIDKPVVLYTSTFSHRLTSAPILREEIARLSGTGRWHWLVTLHPKMARETVEAYRAMQGPNLDFCETDDVLPLLRGADAMVCDTSSILFEFMLLDKPVVTFRHRQPGPQMLDIAEVEALEPAVEQALQRPPGLLDAASAFCDRMHPYRDGRSSERVLEAVESMLAEPPPLKSKPLNLWRRLSMRRELGYWRC